MKTKTYNPSGLVTKKPIFLRLMPHELSDAESIASEAGISKSNLARQAFLAGLPIVKNQLSTSAANSPSQAAELSGGEASASPAGLSTLAA